ncbi:MAG: hypothetical protein EOM85_02375 [Candidatus Moranbacteria bacterium]|nr:hypothetical protein [Candidatus Moranbacteria bacterium]
MKDMFTKRISALLEVKSIVTLALVFSAVWGFVNKMIPIELFGGWVGMILIYFFQKDKGKEGGNE